MSRSSTSSIARLRAFAWSACIIASGLASPAQAQLGRGAVAHDRRDLPLTASNTPARGLAARRPLRGTLGMPIIAGTFADVTPKYDRTVYDTAYFGAHAGVGPYSVARYYDEVSLGALTFTGATTPWIRLPRTRASYVDGDAANVWQRYGEFARDLLQRADATVDWRRYDNDGPDGVPNSGDDDGAVDIAVLLQPGSEYGCGPDSLRGFRETGYRLSLLPGWNGQPYVTGAVGASGTPIVIDDFVGASAVACQGEEITPTRVNIPIHEIGHVLGLPDLYDYDGSSFGVGGWDVMGIWAAPPARPPHFGAWARERLGWATVRHISASGRVELNAVARSGDIVRINLNGGREHVLLEYRAAEGADASAPGTGLVVWHVNDAVLETRHWGVNDDETHPAVRVVQADGRDDLAARANVGDVGDPFPGSSLVIALSDSSKPWLRTSDGGPSGVRIDQIALAGGRVGFDVTFTIAAPVIAAATTTVNASLGQTAFAHTLQATGGAPPYQWRALDALPAGLTLTATGIIQGAPEDLITSRIAVEVRDAKANTATAELDLRVTMPSLTTQQALRGVADPATLDATRRRALDLVGNRNGRLDVGDVVRFRQMLETSVTDASSSP
ncbi:MAG TPA: M6 family metalloprotease domain-containing protein [Gemmatimonadaceae bacterium]|nr:M6 family metalloprotease domain-containing protein [Gemmatimonadaceae bacterium]